MATDDDDMDNNYVKDVMRTMYKFSLNNQFTNFQIRAGEKTAHVHQSVICAKSKFFQAICRSGNKEALMKNASGENEELLSAVVKFLYFGKTNITVQNVESLALSADFINSQELKMQCEAFMMTNLTMTKLKIYADLAQKTDLPALKAECLRFCKEHFSEVSQSDWYLGLSLEEVHSYLNDDELNAPDEYQVLQAVLRWVEHSRATPAGKENYMERLFPCLRLPFCSRLQLDALRKDPKVGKTLKLGLMDFLFDGLHADHNRRRFTEIPPPEAALPGTSSATRSTERIEENVLIVGGVKAGRSALLPFMDIIGLKEHSSDPITQVPMARPSLCKYDGDLVLSGGVDSELTSTALVLKFCVATRSWISLPDMSTPVTYNGSACVDNKLYTIGGCYWKKDQLQNQLASVNVLDLTTMKWSACKSMSLAIDQPGIAVVDEFIFKIGGYTGAEWSTDVQKYNTLMQRWEKCQRIPKPNVKNVHRSTVVVHKHVYVLHKYNFLQYNVDLDTWSELPLPNKPSFRCSMVLHHGSLLVSGGFENEHEEPTDCVQAYDIAQKTWSMEKYTMPLALLGHWAFVVKLPNP